MESKMVKIDIYDKRTERAIKQDINDNFSEQQKNLNLNLDFFEQQEIKDIFLYILYTFLNIKEV